MTNVPLVLRRLLLVLVIGLPLLILVYAVVMGGAALLATLGDGPGAVAMRWIGTTLAVLFFSGAILLVLLLGWERINRSEVEGEEE